MWVLFARAPPADMPYWPGRRWLAVVDAVVWPGLWVVGLQNLPAQGSLIGVLVSALAILTAIRRSYTAVAMNHQYRFTTWRWAKVAASAVSVGWLLGLLFHR